MEVAQSFALIIYESVDDEEKEEDDLCSLVEIKEDTISQHMQAC